MDTHHSPTNSRAALGLAALLITGGSTAWAVDLIDSFDGTALDLTVWERTGPKTDTVDSGALIFADDGDNWGSGDISTHKNFFLPEPGETTTIIWTLGPGTVTTPNPNDEGKTLRYQVGIHSSNETSERKEHWVNSTGGLWIDLDNLQASNTTNASGFAATANDTKTVSSQGSSLGGVSLAWNWETDNHVLKLEITDTEFTWYDGDTFLVSDTWENVGIDTEFGNGFRVLALGMNFSEGRGTTSFEQIEIINGAEAPDLLTSFVASRLDVFSGQKIKLKWAVEDGATVTLDHGIGDVTASTVGGAGEYQITLPIVETLTAVPYLLTVSKGGETATRTLQINVKPGAEIITESFIDDFDGNELELTRWETLGDQSYLIADSKITWGADGSNWSHGEIASIQAYPIPEAGSPTTITWAYGPGEVTVQNEDGTAIRPMMGIFSAYETHPWSRQHWQNTNVGLWLDLTNMGPNRTDGVSGALHVADDTKPFETNAPTLTGVDISDWNWETEGHLFSLVLTHVGFTWFSGDLEIGSGLYADYGLDDEFAAGFKITAMDVNNNGGRGRNSIESITLDNGAVSGPVEILVTDIHYDSSAQTLGLSWTSAEGIFYEIDALQPDGTWANIEDGVPSSGTLTSYILNAISDTSGIYQIRAVAP